MTESIVYRRAAALAAVGLTVLGIASPVRADPPATATVTVDAAHPGGRLAADAVGLSFEMRELGIGNLDPVKGNMTQLMRTLGASNLRIGGNTLDRDTLWVPAGQSPPDPKPDWVQDVVTPGDLKRLRGLLDATGWSPSNAATSRTSGQARRCARPGTTTRSTTPTGWPVPTRWVTPGSPDPTPPGRRRPGPRRWPPTSATGWRC